MINPEIEKDYSEELRLDYFNEVLSETAQRWIDNQDGTPGRVFPYEEIKAFVYFNTVRDPDIPFETIDYDKLTDIAYKKMRVETLDEYALRKGKAE